MEEKNSRGTKRFVGEQAGLICGKNLSCRIGDLARKTDFRLRQRGGVSGQRAGLFGDPNQESNIPRQSLNSANFHAIFMRVRSGFSLEMARKLTSPPRP